MQRRLQRYDKHQHLKGRRPTPHGQQRRRPSTNVLRDTCRTTGTHRCRGTTSGQAGTRDTSALGRHHEKPVKAQKVKRAGKTSGRSKANTDSLDRILIISNNFTGKAGREVSKDLNSSPICEKRLIINTCSST